MSKAALKLYFDDGSRIMTTTTKIEEHSESSSSSSMSRGSVSIAAFYEVDRIVCEICQRLDHGGRIALQFPEELLADSASVVWSLEEALGDSSYLVFVLGDATQNGSCCPDEIGAAYLHADLLVHYGPACLSSSSTPDNVIYSFGVGTLEFVDNLLSLVQNSIKERDSNKLLLLYEVRYHYAMETLKTQLEENAGVEVLLGQIPHYCHHHDDTSISYERSPRCNKKEAVPSATCCKSLDPVLERKNGESFCCQDLPASANHLATTTTTTTTTKMDDNIIEFSNKQQQRRRKIGGLEIPSNTDLSEYILLYIGQADAQRNCHFLYSVLQCSSVTKASWSYDPSSNSPILTTTADFEMKTVHRFLNRRFYLVQKARLASIVGILIGTLSSPKKVQHVVRVLRQKIESSDRACYTFAVGKVNIAKLANFSEVDCFVLVDCNATSILKDEREYHVPIITPYELTIALGEREWGNDCWSCDLDDFLYTSDISNNGNVKGDCPTSDVTEEDDDNCDNGNNDNDDEPFFDMISGTYSTKFKSQQKSSCESVSSQSHQPGQVTVYRSEAAEFWKQREYQGLEANIGKHTARAAIEGQSGIASNYGNR